MKRLAWFSALAVIGLAAQAARAAPMLDPALYSYREQPGMHLPARSLFRDSDGRAVRLNELSHGVPLILVPAYFRCTNLCGIVRAGLLRALRTSGLVAGRDYALVVLSIDPTETGVDARAAKDHDRAAYGSPAVDGDWHYLTGSGAAIQSVTDAVGFRDRLDPQTRQFIHPTGVVFVSPEGVVSNYLLGVGYTPVDIRSGLQRASAGRIAAVGSPVLLICFHFDPTTGRYSLEIMKLIRLAAALTALTVAGTLFLLFRREGIRT
jgi:protein SCO1/2